MMTLSPSDDDTLPRSATVASTRPLMLVDWGGASSTGLVRSNNQDSWGERHSRLFVVADGMGGMNGGEVASAAAVAQFLSADPSDGWLSALRRIGEAIVDLATEQGVEGAGTTLVGLVLEPVRCTILSIGDSRAYRLRDGELEQLTVDHNIATWRAEQGLDPNERDPRGGPGALTSFLGSPDHEQRADVSTVAIQPGDRLLLCTDGIHGQIDNSAIIWHLTTSSCEDSASGLVRAANLAGGRDNATAVVLEMG